MHWRPAAFGFAGRPCPSPHRRRDRAGRADRQAGLGRGAGSPGGAPACYATEAVGSKAGLRAKICGFHSENSEILKELWSVFSFGRCGTG